jgi:hypothetical protein
MFLEFWVSLSVYLFGFLCLPSRCCWSLLFKPFGLIFFALFSSFFLWGGFVHADYLLVLLCCVLLLFVLVMIMGLFFGGL